jgi:two-component system, OmpR family, phosphate regulon sensor histidine kinase PhoR
VKRRNLLTLGLIQASILLLLALQVFWLHSSYEKAFYDFRREANGIFKNTVFELRDSLFASTLSPYIDSTRDFTTNGAISQIRILRDSFKTGDSIRFKKQSSSVQVYISSTGTSDSIAKTLGPLTRRLQTMRDKNPMQSFTFRIAPDSLNIDSLSYHYQKNLIANAIFSKVIIEDVSGKQHRFGLSSFMLPTKHEHEREDFTKSNNELSLFGDTLQVDPIRLNPVKQYRASLTGIRALMLKEITPQILFSLFLTITITAAFIVMYRNIVSQQKLMNLKNDFISNITHELKTPVATVSVALEALQNFNITLNPERNKEYLSIAQQELTRLSTLTDKILKTTIFEESGIFVQAEDVDLNNTVSEVLSSMKLLLDKWGVVVRFTANTNHAVVTGSALHLSNVISNLIENSLKYSSAKPEIDISILSESNRLLVSVKDNGIGVAPEYHRKVFEKFFRVPTGNVHTIKGYGLGLSYVAGVVKAHKGTITLQSELGKGSEFIIALPYKNIERQ